MSPPLLKLDNIALTFGGKPLLTDANLSVSAEDKIALVGRNGAGKSTLLKIAAGIMPEDNGEIFRHPRSKIGYLEQSPSFQGYTDIKSYLLDGFYVEDVRHKISILLEKFSLKPDMILSNLSGGEARKVAIIRFLVQDYDVLLLDEPTNHLDLQMIEWLEKELIAKKTALVIISHDRYFLEKITNKIVWLERGVTKEYSKGFAFFETWKEKLFEEEVRQHHKLERKLVSEEDWLRYGVSGRRKRNVKRLDDLHELRKQVKQVTPVQKLTDINFGSSNNHASKLVIEAKNIFKSYGERCLIKNFSIRILRNDRVGVVGANGVGKTTLLSLLTQKILPDSGNVRMGKQLEVASLAQMRAFEPGESLSNYLTDGRGHNLVVNGEEKHITSYMKAFSFLAEQMNTPVEVLSGGEKARLLLARLLSRPANFLVLDEPTNDLDMETLDFVEDLVCQFQGTVFIISHDRGFLDRTVNKLLVAEGDGSWTEYAGGYTDMLKQRGVNSLITNKDNKLNKKVKKTADKDTVSKTAAPKSAEKLSFKDQFLLDKLPQEIDELTIQIAEIERKLTEGNLYEKNREAFFNLSKDLDIKKQSLDEKENQWIVIEMKREALELERKK